VSSLSRKLDAHDEQLPFTAARERGVIPRASSRDGKLDRQVVARAKRGLI